MKHLSTSIFIIIVIAFVMGGCYKEQHFDMPGPYGEKDIVPDTLPFPFDSTRQAGVWLVKNGIPDYTKAIFKGYSDFYPQFGDTLAWYAEEGCYTSRQCWNFYALDNTDHGYNSNTSYQYASFFTKPFVKYASGSKWYFYAKMSLPYVAGTAPYFWFGSKSGFSKRHTAGIDGGSGFNGNPIFFAQIDGALINSNDWPIMTEVMTPGEPFELELVCVDYFVYFKINGRVIWYYNVPQDVHSMPIMFCPWRNSVSFYDVYMEGDIEEVIDFVCNESEGNYITIQSPALTQAANGDVLLFAEGRVAEYELTSNEEYARRRSNATDIVMKRSTDGGSTWNTLTTLVGDRNTVNISPVALTGSNGKNYLLYTLDKSGYLDGSTFDIYQMTSDNNGGSWSAPQKITTDLQGEYAQSTLSGHGIELEHGDHAGRLVVLTQCSKTNVNTVAAIYSDDQGATWTAGTPVNMNNATGGNIVELSDGRLMVILSHNETTTKCKVTYSSDGGQSWSEPEFGNLATGTRGYRYAGATVSRNGKITHFTPSNQMSSFANDENRIIGSPAYGEGFGITTSDDDGQTWNSFETLFTKYTYDAYYFLCRRMDAVVLDDGQILCITEGGVKCPKEGLVRFYK